MLWRLFQKASTFYKCKNISEVLKRSSFLRFLSKNHLDAVLSDVDVVDDAAPLEGDANFVALTLS